MDDDESDILVGKFRLYYIDIASAINTGYIDVFDIFDAHSDSTSEYYDSLFDPDTVSFSKNLQRLFDYEIFEQSFAAENKSSWHAKMQLSGFRETERDSIRKLRNHYGKLGFVEMKGTPHMFLSTTRRLPPIERLLT